MPQENRLNEALAQAFADDPGGAARAYAAVAPIVAALEAEIDRMTALLGTGDAPADQPTPPSEPCTGASTAATTTSVVATQRTMSDADLRLLDVHAMNARLSSYRLNLRASDADALRYVELWNQHKLSTAATLVADRAAGWYQIAILDT